MADKTKLTSWVFNNRNVLQSNFVEFNWPDRYFSGLHDFKATLTVGEVTATGRGIDTNPEVAIEKASAEAIERLICLKLNIGSVGFAVSGENSAKCHAEMEALERYYFSEHLRLQRPFIEVTKETPVLSEPAQLLISKFKTKNSIMTPSFYAMATHEPFFGVVCNISNEPNTPLILGLALHDDPSKALQRAFKEALVNYARLLDAPEDFQSEVSTNHDLWNCNKAFTQSIRHLFSNADPTLGPIISPRLKFEYLDISKIAELSQCPITPIRCIAEAGV